MMPELANSALPAQSARGPALADPSRRPGAAHLLAVLSAALLAVLLTRWPILPPHLFSFDAVNLALALHHFDPTRNQPQPPGYPLFVLEGRALLPFLGTPERVFAVIQILASGLSLMLLYLAGAAIFSAPVGAISAALLLFNPPFWFSGLTSPLRPHLALFSPLIAYCCWRATDRRRDSPRDFYLASLALAIAGGFRPELLVILLPLWLWTAWQCGWRTGVRGALLAGLITLAWAGFVVAACGGLERTLLSFRIYGDIQTVHSSALWGVSEAGWRHMAGRALLWTGMGALPWIWTLPFSWHSLPRWGSARRPLLFLALWGLPGLAFHMTVHSGDPDHVLVTVPVVCLLGGLCLHSAAERLGAHAAASLSRIHSVFWLAAFAGLLFLFAHGNRDWREIAVWGAVVCGLLPLTRLAPAALRGLLLSIALLGNVLLFTASFPFPHGPAPGRFRGWASLRDAFFGAVYESSYDRVRWSSDMTELTLREVPRLIAQAPGPPLLVWARDGVPVWRKLSYYFPNEKLYVLDQAGDPGVPGTQASVWAGNQLVRRFASPAPIRVLIPERSRIIWFGGGDEAELARAITLRKAFTLEYGDLPRGSFHFRWKAFELVTEQPRQ